MTTAPIHRITTSLRSSFKHTGALDRIVLELPPEIWDDIFPNLAARTTRLHEIRLRRGHPKYPEN